MGVSTCALILLLLALPVLRVIPLTDNMQILLWADAQFLAPLNCDTTYIVQHCSLLANPTTTFYHVDSQWRSISMPEHWNSDSLSHLQPKKYLRSA